MNRRQFTILLATSFSQIGVDIPSYFQPTLTNNLGTENVLKKVYSFWVDNMKVCPQFYIEKHNINEKNFQTIKMKELSNEQLLEFEGVYFAYCELALLAALAANKV